MRFLNIVPFVALSVAFVIPDEEVMSQVAIESHQAPESILEKLPTKDQALVDFENNLSKLIDASKGTLDHVLESAADISEEATSKAHKAAFDTEAWLESVAGKLENFEKHDKDNHKGHCKPNLTVCPLAFCPGNLGPGRRTLIRCSPIGLRTDCQEQIHDQVGCASQ